MLYNSMYLSFFYESRPLNASAAHPVIKHVKNIDIQYVINMLNL